MDNQIKSCRNCKFAIFHDYGYSNWTTEGTERFCTLVGLNMPDLEVTFDDDKAMQDAAIQCGCYSQGEPIEMDCEEEGVADLNNEQKDMWDRYYNPKN